MTGIADVIASATLRGAGESNSILRFLAAAIGEAGEEFEVIIDYKGMRRPGVDELQWKYHRWQILTYAWLRSRQAGSRPVKAGIIFYLNELVPSGEDLIRLREEVEKGNTDVLPEGEDREKLLGGLGKKNPDLSQELRMRRSIKVIPVDGESIEESLREFDRVVAEIERSVSQEKSGYPIKRCWQPNPRKETCDVCDFNTFCPRPDRAYHPTVP
ncbi:PD-(D/E)XK nuclease family protein [Desulfothermobacter acidiphilus]|uniref:PD-(D/E)XK nuclease family protein n=1 Tax=Desulfothermobacter acidiphilus TaxID=1938353 RepID=UPI003F89971B